MTRANRFDLILANGAYWIDVPSSLPPRQWQGEMVAKALYLRSWHRAPGVGKLLRNAWAKRNGAQLGWVHHSQAR